MASQQKAVFKTELILEQRQALSRHILEKFPERIPVIVEVDPSKAGELPAIKKKKYLAPADLSLGSFLGEIRRSIAKERPRRNAEEGVEFIFGDGTIANGSMTMAQCYRIHRDPEDSFLYLFYTVQNVFG